MTSNNHINHYELDLINRYLPDIQVDYERLHDGNHIHDCLSLPVVTADHLISIRSLTSSSMRDIEIVTNALLSINIDESLGSIISILNILNERNDVDDELLNRVIRKVTHDVSPNANFLAGVLRNTLMSKFYSIDKSNLASIFETCNYLRDGFTYNSAMYSNEPIGPLRDRLRAPLRAGAVSEITVNNQALVAIVRRAFKEGISSIRRDDLNLSYDELVSLIATEDSSPAIGELIFEPRELTGSGENAEALTHLAKELSLIRDAGCRIDMTKADTVLISDLLMVFSQTIAVECDAARKAQLSKAVIDLVDMCCEPVGKLEFDGRKRSFFLQNTVRSQVVAAELFHNLDSSSRHSISGERDVDEAIARFYYDLLINIALASENWVSKANLKPLDICGQALVERCLEKLTQVEAFKGLGKSEKEAILNSCSDIGMKKKILATHRSLSRSSFKSDLGL